MRVRTLTTAGAPVHASADPNTVEHPLASGPVGPATAAAPSPPAPCRCIHSASADDDFRIIDDVLQYPYPCRICGTLVSEEVGALTVSMPRAVLNLH